MPKISKRSMIKLIIFLGLLLLLVPIAEQTYQARLNKVQPFAVQCLEGWAHRGYVNPEQGFPENSLASYQQAIALGAAGIEMDTYYDVELNDFIISHSKTYQLQADGTPLRLHDALTALPKVHIWLDAKNLYKLMPWQASKATARLKDMIGIAGRKDDVLIESRSPFYLRDLANAGFQTTLMISPETQHNALWLGAEITMHQLLFSVGQFNGISMNYSDYRGSVVDAFGQAPTYLATINDEKQLPIMIGQSQIKVFLTDNPALYGLHCADGSKKP